MKKLLCMFVGLLLISCSLVDSSSFKYLDDEDVELHSILITGTEQDVLISLPKALTAKLPDSLLMKPEGLELPYTKALDIPYEWLWGGPIHKDEGLYLFELAFSYHPGRHLLSESVEERKQNIRQHFEDFEEGKWRDVVLDRLIVEDYQSSQGYVWVMENVPTVMQYHEYFSLPISDERNLNVWFWYSQDWVPDHPDWYERRKALSRRILDSVRLIEPK